MSSTQSSINLLVLFRRDNFLRLCFLVSQHGSSNAKTMIKTGGRKRKQGRENLKEKMT